MLTDVISLQLLQRVPNAYMGGTARIASKVGRLRSWLQGVAAVVHAELCGQNQLISILTGLNPLANPELRLLILVNIGCVDEVATGLTEGIKELERGVFVDRVHEARPGIAKRHAAQL